jgi:adenine C2-methylase RlmN of 23S rRNA A2503 and tRNA A37
VPYALYSRRVVLCRPFIATDLGHIFCAVPKIFRDALEAEGWSMGRSTIHHSTISSDGTVKILLRLVDSRLVETVGIPVEEKSGGS